MERYWIVVGRENRELYEALTVAFRGRTGFRVLLDRRCRQEPRRGRTERREAPVRWGLDEFIVAERREAPAAVWMPSERALESTA